jgi:hypothetical protein
MRLSPPLTSLIVTWPFGATSDDPRLVGVVHRGVDLRAVVGTPVYAAADGAAVALSQYDVGFGHYMRLGLGTVTLDGWDGSRITGDVVVYYAHLSERITSQPVTRDALIGYSGETGYCLGAHLHWEVRVDGVSVDPMLYVEGWMESWEEQRERALAASKEHRWRLEAHVVRALQRADALEAEAERIRSSVRRELEAMVSTVDGSAYRAEVLLGGDVPAKWGDGA